MKEENKCSNSQMCVYNPIMAVITPEKKTGNRYDMHNLEAILKAKKYVMYTTLIFLATTIYQRFSPAHPQAYQSQQLCY